MQNSLPIIECLLENKFPEKNENILLCLKCLYQIIYFLCKIRGRQTILKFFCSEVYVFEPVISILLSLDSHDPENCDLIYVLILWTSILGLIPFDVETIDTKGIIINELPEYFKNTLNSSSNLRDITAYALSKFITRPDIIKKGILNEILNFYINFLHDNEKNTNIFMCAGVMSSLYEIFKNGIPTDLVGYVGLVVKNVINYNFPDYMLTGGVMRRYFSKLTTRIGMIILKPKFQKWRYSKELKNLLDKNKSNNKDNKNNNNNNDNENDDINNINNNEDFDYDLDFETLEILIDKMLNTLIDREYIVRWSSAKGIGRICERLTKNMVDDILENIFELFNDEENEFSWQGGILAIAELCKRGMILPEKLSKVMHYLEKAFIFEVNKGTFCLGSNVRDSACYLAWALARAYSKKVMHNYIQKLAQNLIIVMLFDKEVNCRRAASAAFQEHVGRQGYFPNGIEIITEADYFTLGNRSNCFLNISTFVSLFPDYRHVVLDYLSNNRILHVEENIRILSAEALGLLVPFDEKYFIEKIIPHLLQISFSSNLSYRQGAIMGIGYILVGLRGKWDFEIKSKRIRMKVIEGMNAVESKVLEDSEYRKNFEEKFLQIKFVDHLANIMKNETYFNENFKNLQKEIFNLPYMLEKKNLYRGKGGEIMRTAINNYIRLICVAELELEEIYILQYLDILIENLKHPNLDIQKDACVGINCLMNQIEDFNKNEKENENKNKNNKIFSDEGKKEIEKKIKDLLKNSISEESIYINRGYTMCLSYLSEDFIKENFIEIFQNLFLNCKVKMQKNEKASASSTLNAAVSTELIKSNYNDFETRRISIESLCEITIKLSKDNKNNLEILGNYFDKIFEYIFDGLKDYEIDKKFGDVGALIRASAMKSLTSLMLHCFKSAVFVLINSNNTNFKDNIFANLFLKNGKLFICGLFKQLAEKLNKIRHTSGESLQKFFHEINKEIKRLDSENHNTIINFLISSIPEFLELSEFFLNDLKFNDIGEIHNIDWLEPSYCFDKISKFLVYDDYSFAVFEGIIISIGGLTEDVQRFSLLGIDDIIKKDT
jgi:hypothetical protein